MTCIGVGDLELCVCEAGDDTVAERCLELRRIETSGLTLCRRETLEDCGIDERVNCWGDIDSNGVKHTRGCKLESIVKARFRGVNPKRAESSLVPQNCVGPCFGTNICGYKSYNLYDGLKRSTLTAVSRPSFIIYTTGNLCLITEYGPVNFAPKEDFFTSSRRNT